MTRRTVMHYAELDLLPVVEGVVLGLQAADDLLVEPGAEQAGAGA